MSYNLIATFIIILLASLAAYLFWRRDWFKKIRSREALLKKAIVDSFAEVVKPVARQKMDEAFPEMGLCEREDLIEYLWLSIAGSRKLDKRELETMRNKLNAKKIVDGVPCTLSEQEKELIIEEYAEIIVQTPDINSADLRQMRKRLKKALQ